MPRQTSIASFILRFVQERAADASAAPAQTAWHGIIKHVQTNEQQRFATIADMVAFIDNYICLDAYPGAQISNVGDIGPQSVAEQGLDVAAPDVPLAKTD